MPRKSANPEAEMVRMKASDLPPTTPERMAELIAAMDGPIDTSDIPEQTVPIHRLVRDADGRLPRPLPELRESPIRRAILAELERRQMTRYQLWQAAREHCPTLPSSAVYEYLRGRRDIGVPYAEALMQAAGLVVTSGPARDDR